MLSETCLTSAHELEAVHFWDRFPQAALYEPVTRLDRAFLEVNLKFLVHLQKIMKT